jgi:hypothetical protein
VDFIITPPCVLPPTASCWQIVFNMAALKKTPLDQKRLPYPQITHLAAAQRAQRHVPDSIATLRYRLAWAIVRKLPRCPYCNMVNRR